MADARRLMQGGGALAALAMLVMAAGASAQDSVHTVQPGETLNGIANRAGVASSAIAAANGLQPPYAIRAGQKLKIPHAAGAVSGAAPRATAPAASGPGSYTVKAGETLGGIANREGVPRVLIAEANGLAPPYHLRAGQTLLIPRTRHHTVAAGETGFAIAMEYAVPWSAIVIANGMDENDPLRAGQRLLIPTVLDRAAPAAAPPTTAAPSASASRFIWPLSGTVRREYRARGSSNYHDGIDITAPRGTAARAVAAGTVIFAGPEPSQFGNLVVIDHGGGWHSAYGSLDQVTVKKGERAAQGERVGTVGNTSVTRQTELHFELRKDNKAVDPIPLLGSTVR